MIMQTVRPYRPQDKTALIELWKKCGLTRPWNDPNADIELAVSTPTSTIMIGADAADRPVGSVMTGFDGHRGWLYYVAVDPDIRGSGHGRTLCNHAETWLKTIGCTKVEAIMRGENTNVRGFYDAMGYFFEDRVLMAKWLIPNPLQIWPMKPHSPTCRS